MSDTHNEQPPADIFPLTNIDEPGHHDVLCGRGVTTNRHEGNVQYRGLVALNKEIYVTSTKKQKMKISRSVVEAIRSLDPPGRFLDKDVETGLWYDIGDRKAVEKTSQALRDGAAEVRKQLSQDLSDPNFLTAVFDVDPTLDGSSSTMSTESSSKQKAKPVKAKASVKKRHRRAISNPNTLVEKKKCASMSRGIEFEEFGEEVLPKPLLSPASSIGSFLPVYDLPERAASFDCLYSYQDSPESDWHSAEEFACTLIPFV